MGYSREALKEYLSTPYGAIEIDNRNHRVISYILTLDGESLFPDLSSDGIIY